MIARVISIIKFFFLTDLDIGTNKNLGSIDNNLLLIKVFLY